MMQNANNEWKAVFKTDFCTGCCTCEMACSYHHTRTFRPSVSSIKIISKPEELGFDISFFKSSKDGHLACNGCQGRAEPFCVTYCPVIARNELRNTVDRFQRSRGV